MSLKDQYLRLVRRAKVLLEKARKELEEDKVTLDINLDTGEYEFQSISKYYEGKIPRDYAKKLVAEIGLEVERFVPIHIAKELEDLAVNDEDVVEILSTYEKLDLDVYTKCKNKASGLKCEYGYVVKNLENDEKTKVLDSITYKIERLKNRFRIDFPYQLQKYSKLKNI